MLSRGLAIPQVAATRSQPDSFKATRAKLAQHPIEDVGAKLRDMPWIKKGALVDKAKN
jgi:hypothetical protein